MVPCFSLSRGWRARCCQWKSTFSLIHSWYGSKGRTNLRYLNRDIDLLHFLLSNRSHDRAKNSRLSIPRSPLWTAFARECHGGGTSGISRNGSDQMFIGKKRIPQLSLGEYGFVVATVSRAG